MKAVVTNTVSLFVLYFSVTCTMVGFNSCLNKFLTCTTKHEWEETLGNKRTTMIDNIHNIELNEKSFLGVMQSLSLSKAIHMH